MGLLQVWKDFEVKHGNEDTLREMLRIKRSVQAVYNTQVRFTDGIVVDFQHICTQCEPDIWGVFPACVVLQVNMMASAMMQEGAGGLGTVADLAPSLTMGLKVVRGQNLNELFCLTLNFAYFFNLRTTCGGWKLEERRVMSRRVRTSS